MDFILNQTLSIASQMTAQKRKWSNEQIAAP